MKPDTRMGRREFLQDSVIALGTLPFAANVVLDENGITTIQMPRQASALETLAAKEVARYLYLCTGKLLPIYSSDSSPKRNTVIIAHKNWPPIALAAGVARSASTLQAQQHFLKSETAGDGKRVWIIGGDDVGVLYGAYRFLEKFGVRFYLHEDVIPEARVPLSLPDVEEKGKPVFELRGLHPWGGHAEGIDLWDTDQYKAIFSQMAKMRMNFVLIHSFPSCPPYLRYSAIEAEPAVWVGLPQDVDERGHVRFSVTADYWSTARAIPRGYRPKKTGQYRFGGSLLFESDEWGAEVMHGQFPYATTVEGRNEVFNRAGEMFRQAFTFARALGMKTAMGTQGGPVTPSSAEYGDKHGESRNLQQFGPSMMISEELQEHLRKLGKNPYDPAVIEEIYEGIFQRIMKMYPLDYYVIFTQERWYWEAYDEARFNALIEEWKLALRAWEKLKPPFGLATGGWVLGPSYDHAALDKVLPKHVALSEFSRAYTAPVDEAFGRIQGRPKWAIPWIDEDSPILTPELWVGRIRKDAADALAYGCNALLALLYRTFTTQPSAAAIAYAGWDQSGWNPEFGKEHPLPPPSTFYQEGPVSRGANIDMQGYTPDATPTGSISPFQAIFNTQDDPLYRTYWRGLSGYRLKVPNGLPG